MNQSCTVCLLQPFSHLFQAAFNFTAVFTGIVHILLQSACLLYFQSCCCLNQIIHVWLATWIFALQFFQIYLNLYHYIFAIQTQLRKWLLLFFGNHEQEIFQRLLQLR
ncbi:unnamed protein product [Paramecium octaurelia]|uniref:Transmembrane protein n=1 Tax=Paramecium octaurelia TaxID=43137 RepID=A0A8S1W7U7_PAROT|nr:unnamed protein product [Paramecium octaurelia]